MGVKLVASSGGSVELVPTNTASNFTVTVPAKTGTMAMDGPAFSAYLSSAQALTGGVTTKVTFQTEEFDTNSNYDNATNYRFTPTVAGYYQVNGSIRANTAFTTGTIYIYKNGSSFKQGNFIQTNGAQFTVAALIYLNGSTDYVEIYANFTTGQNLSANLQETYFQASMVRGA